MALGIKQTDDSPMEDRAKHAHAYLLAEEILSLIKKATYEGYDHNQAGRPAQAAECEKRMNLEILHACKYALEQQQRIIDALHKLNMDRMNTETPRYVVSMDKV